jgi:hypothetical protein
MKRQSGFSGVVVGIVLVALSVANAAAQDDAARVRELEDRVQRLEALVQTLLAQQSTTAEKTSADISAKLDSKQDQPSNPDLRGLPWTRKPLPQELLPNLGKIGATVSFASGLNSGPFALNHGSYFGGTVELPLALLRGGRLNYEIGIALAQARRNLPVTSSVAQVANLTVLNALLPDAATNVQDSLTGTGAAPFAVTANADWRAQILQLTPFALKYDFTRLDRIRIRPYALAGLGTYVTVSSQNVAGSGLRADSTLSAGDLSLLNSLLGNSSAFGGALIGGQIAPAGQLAARKLPAGQGGVDLGVHYGAGVEWRISGLTSLSFDARFNRVPDGLSYHTLAARWGLHF